MYDLNQIKECIRKKAQILNLDRVLIFGPDNSLLWGTVLCVVGCIAAPLVSIH